MTAMNQTRLPIIRTTPWDRIKFKVYALALLAIILAGAVMSGLAYKRTFTSTIPVTLKAGRAGLQMYPGNRVKVQGVDLGRVKSVELTPDQSGVDIVMYLDPELAHQVPVNVEASLEQLTAFGDKTVQLTMPSNPSPQTLEAGSAINVDNVAGEINNTFDHLMTVIDAVQPAKLNATLGAFAGALQGNGDSLGATLTKADRYLAKFNGNLPALQNDFRVVAGFANVYADAAPNIANVVSNLGVTTTTFANGDFPPVLRSLTALGNEAAPWFEQNLHPLSDALESLLPTTSLLKKYSPALTCFLDGAAKTYDNLNTADESGIQFEFSFHGGPGPYKYPRDLPENGPGLIPPGPDCHGLPSLGPGDLSKADATVGPSSLAPGREGNTPQILPRQPALVQFFGPDALPALKGGK